MSEYTPLGSYDSENAMTIELTNDQSFEMSPHNTALFEFTGDGASRNHIFSFTSTDDGDLKSVYIFRTFDPETYDEIRQQILANPDYEVTLSDEVDPCEEHAYQKQVDQHVDTWRQDIPDTAIDFLITTAK